LFQISIAFVTDICRVRYRYLSCSFQTSVSCELDIIKNYHPYNSTLSYLKVNYLAEDYELFNPNLLLEPKHILFYCLVDCLS